MEAGFPLFGVDITAENLPQEVGRDAKAISFTKGCYVGQENTARMHYRAKVSRRLVVVPLGEGGDRTRVTYPDLDLMVELRRVEALGDACVPQWLASVLNAPEGAGG